MSFDALRVSMGIIYWIQYTSEEEFEPMFYDEDKLAILSKHLLTIPSLSTKTTRNVSKKSGHTTYKKFTLFLISKDRVS